MSTEYFDYGLTVHYYIVGYFKKSLEITEKLLKNDPFNQALRESYIVGLGASGHTKQAEKEYEICKVIFKDQHFLMVLDGVMTFFHLSYHDFLSINDIPEIPPSMQFLEILREHLESPENALSEFRKVYNNDNLSAWELGEVASVANILGDPELAWNAMERSARLSVSFFWLVWHPEWKEVRQLPQFKEYVREIGLVDYWKEYGWPDLCHPADEDDFVCE